MASLENPSKKEESVEDAQVGLNAKESEFIVDDDDKGIDVAIEDDDGNESDEETVLFDSVCAFCDNGGELLCCEGRCIRSFHPTVDSGEESNCKSLGFSKIQVEAMQNFLCLNCQYKIHQCFACGKLGSSDKTSSAEVFQCVSATCAYFYHPECVAKLLHPDDEGEAEELENRICGGEQFTCPAHECYVCKQREQTDILELQFAVCRRCPKAYHRKCLPRKIAFDGSEDNTIMTRAWDGLLPHNRVLIYCLKHKMDETLATPIRNHICFPDFEEKKKKLRLEDLSRKRKAVGESRFVDIEVLRSERVESKVTKHVLSDTVKHTGCIMKREKLFSEKPKKPDESRMSPRDSIKGDKSSAVVKSNESCREEMFSWSQLLKSKDKEVCRSKYEKKKKKHTPCSKQDTYQLDAETKKRLKAMMVQNASLVTVEDIVKGHKVPSIYANSSKTVVDKNITLGKVEGFVEAVRTALQKLEKGGSVEDAKAVCGPEIVNQLIRWKSKLTVYLSPFLHGMRYTSFGRHFTKVEKLKEIVDKLHWYTQTGDMIVDFCCGANDFSWLMKQKLEETGKRCSFKNYDIIQPKNDFCFEKRDWMTVSPGELPAGSNLIMGINPPFGVKAALANKFIDKALKFQPKIIILIVPPETERLDKKKPAYDLVWEDIGQLSGKSFYLPGSVDIHDNQIEQWNITPPPLYLWSHSDWTTKHKAIALERGHITKEQKEYCVSAGWGTVDLQNLEGMTGVSTQIPLLDNMTSQYPYGSLPNIHPNMSAYAPGIPYAYQQPPGSLPSICSNRSTYAPGIPQPPGFHPSICPDTSAYPPGTQQLPGSVPSVCPNTSSWNPATTVDLQNLEGMTGVSTQIPLLDNMTSQYPYGSLPSIHPNMSAYAPGIPYPYQQPPGPLPSICSNTSTYAPGIPQPPGFHPSICPDTSTYPPGTQQQPGSVPTVCLNTSTYARRIRHPSQQPPGSFPSICPTTSAYAPGIPHPSHQPPGYLPIICPNMPAFFPGIPHPSQEPPGSVPSICPDMPAFTPLPTHHSHQNSSGWRSQ